MVKADDILLFVFVVEEGSFSKVSVKHEITMSVVSKRIARLEKALNVQLLYRTTRKLSLTEAGKALYQKAIVAQQAIQDAQDVVSGFGSIVRGKIRITMPVVTANLVLNQALTDFCEQYPGVDVELLVSNRVVDMLDERYDLAIRTADLEDSSLIGRRLIDSSWIVCASPEYLNRNGTPEHPDDLLRHQCVLYKYEDKKMEAWKFHVNDQDYPVQVNSRFRTNTLDTLKQSALSGFGIAYLPRALIHEELLSGHLVPLLSPFVAKNLGIYAVYPKTRQPNKMLNLLVEHFRQALQRKKEYFY
ncbi:LysR family transcriptional regulator [Aliiglaciecola sp. 3_MG-2023]|uniref:LysR family transcriptional regulator n=1 Tax=Aliiglaciecola sp. 3_MG-2023 TaxID=3062644 RepID=UPI0026E47EC4|nr:LysR family transcriptional regulator [Aliiglaciecola sp. 3_MG-2023]MDO6694636.1 LysR family transcriptional regulator [Aliiglaciecola sp. 3_MG-2023]